MTQTADDQSNALTRALTRPGDELPADIEISLLGQPVLGLDPEAIDTDSIQYRQIHHAFSVVTDRVRDGHRDDIIPTIRFLLHTIGITLVGILERAYQHKKMSLSTKKKARSVLQSLWAGLGGTISDEKEISDDLIQLRNVILKITSGRSKNG